MSRLPRTRCEQCSRHFPGGSEGFARSQLSGKLMIVCPPCYADMTKDVTP